MDERHSALNAWQWTGSALLLLVIAVLVFYVVRHFGGFNGFRAPEFAETLPDSPIVQVAPKPVPMATYEEVRREYERRRSLWQGESDQVVRRQQELAALDYRSMSAEALLPHTSVEERTNLAAVLELAPSAAPSELIGSLRRAGSHSIATMFRGQPVPYEEVVLDVAVELGAKKPLSTSSLAKLEEIAIKAAMDKVLASASPQQRQALAVEMAKAQSTSSGGLIAATGGLVLANLSGFGLYVAASTSLAAVTGAVGVTLPFAAYTGLSSVLAAATGPIGWAALAAVAVYQFGGTAYKKTVPGVLVVASARARLMAERESDRSTLARQRTVLDLSASRLAVLSKFVDEMQRTGTNSTVPRASVPW